MITFRPATLVLLYFCIVVLYGVYPFEFSIPTWITMEQWHDVIAALAGFSFAFKKSPEDKAAMVGLVFYVLGLALFDQHISWVYGWEIILIGAVFSGWISFIWFKSLPIQGEKET